MTSRNSGDPKVDAMNEEELAKYFEDRKDDPSIWEAKGRRIRARRGPSTVFQMRIAPEELEEIARAAGGNVSEFVRTAALEKARNQTRKGAGRKDTESKVVRVQLSVGETDSGEARPVELEFDSGRLKRIVQGPAV